MRQILIILSLLMLYACAHTASISLRHPVEVDSMPKCGECHTDKYQAYDHDTGSFYEKHGIYARQQRLACDSCHVQSFCADCHTNKEEIKPSDKFLNSPERSSPHRGNYMSLHKIEGKIDPASCVKCHGRQNNWRCAPCHR